MKRRMIIICINVLGDLGSPGTWPAGEGVEGDGSPGPWCVGTSLPSICLHPHPKSPPRKPLQKARLLAFCSFLMNRGDPASGWSTWVLPKVQGGVQTQGKVTPGVVGEAGGGRAGAEALLGSFPSLAWSLPRITAHPFPRLGVYFCGNPK